MPSDITIWDLLALMWFFTTWYSIAWIGRHYKHNDKTTLYTISKNYRNQWMRNLLERENRMSDVALIGNLMRSVSFFASTSILILASLIAVFGVVDDALKIFHDIPYAQQVTATFWKLKLFLMVFIFVYAFFKLVWSLRQYNSTVIMIGAAPDSFDTEEELFAYANNLSIVLNRSSQHFIEGMRGFEFALAAMAWFIHPLVFFFATLMIGLVIYRREFASRTMRAMTDSE